MGRAMYNMLLFLSTPSARRATGRRSGGGWKGWHFYPRPPRGGRRAVGGVIVRRSGISIHALREEGDQRFFALSSRMIVFLSTPSARRATPPAQT